MAISVTFPNPPQDFTPAKGTAGLRTQLGGACTTVTALREAGKAIGNAEYVK